MKHHRSDTRSQPRRSHFHQTTVPPRSGSLPARFPTLVPNSVPKQSPEQPTKPADTNLVVFPFHFSGLPLRILQRISFCGSGPSVESPIPPRHHKFVSQMAPNPRFAAHGGLSPMPTPFSGPGSRQILIGPWLTSCDSAPSLYCSMTTFASVVETSTIAK